jgi:hypothetical protein
MDGGNGPGGRLSVMRMGTGALGGWVRGVRDEDVDWQTGGWD